MIRDSIKITAVLITFLFLLSCGEDERILTVGGKNFAGNYILTELVSILLEKKGDFIVEQKTGLSSAAVRAALLKEDIDLYVENTGTAWTQYLGHKKKPAGPDVLFMEVKDEDSARNGIVWLEPFNVHDGFALVLRPDFAAENELETISDFSEFSSANPEQVSLGMDTGFLEDEEGFSAFSESYRMRIPEDRITALEIGRSFDALAGNKLNAAIVFAADGRNHAYDLVLLTDDKAFFMPQNPSLCLRRGILDQYPEISDILDNLRNVLDQKSMQEMNYRVTVLWQDPRDVAESFLRDRDIVP